MSELSDEIYFGLKKEGLHKTTCKAIKQLVDYLVFDDNLPTARLRKFKKLNILNNDNQVSLEHPEQMLEWILLGLVYENKLELHTTETIESDSK